MNLFVNNPFIYIFLIKIVSTFADVMMKYIFFISLGAFLLLGLSSSPGKDKYKFRMEIGAIITESPNLASRITIKHICDKMSFLKEDRQSSMYSHNFYDGVVANPLSSRFFFPSKILKINPSLAVVQILSSLKSQLHKDKRTAFSYNVNLAKYSQRYYIYTLEHILV